LEYRLFIQKVASQLGISKKVLLYVSEVVSSPVTIGYLKPIILLPFAALNNLSVHQVEAILLHELSHIRRYDYLVNFIISIIHTLLYFNPFIKYFIRQIEEERENCCDEMVLQYGYDKVSYASALLTLEKASAQHHLLVLGATGKKNLITRIEKIIGMEKKKSFRLAHLVPVFAAIICILTFNSILIINDAKQNGDLMLSSNHVVHPFYFIENSSKEKSQTPAVNLTTGSNQSHVASNSAIPKVTDVFTFEETTEPAAKPMELPEGFIHVDFDEVDAQLSKEQKKQVKTTVEATKKVMTTLQWLEVENAIADVLNKDEKALVKDEYLRELEALNWNNVELNLKSNYDKIDWSKVNNNISNALTVIQLDSIQRSYNLILSQIEKAEAQVNGKLKDCISPLPDVSVEEMKKTKEEVKKNIEAVKAVQEKKIIKI